MKNTLLKCNSLAWQYLTHVTSCNIACIKTLAEGFCFPALRGLTQFELNCTSYTGVSGCLSPWKVSMPFALAVLMCWARSALPMSAWHVTALCMSGSEHTQFHRSLTLQARSCLVERLPVACLDMLGCVITCGVGGLSAWEDILWMLLCALGETCCLWYHGFKFCTLFSYRASSVTRMFGKDWWWGLCGTLGIKCVNCALIRWQRGKHQVKNVWSWHADSLVQWDRASKQMKYDEFWPFTLSTLFDSQNQI